MGEIYLVADRAGGNRMALKLALPLDPSAMAGGLSAVHSALAFEFHFLRELQHPNLPAIYEFGFDADLRRPYFTLSYHDGLTLDEAWNALDTTGRLAVVRQVLSALQYIHDQRLVHYDIKPRNVLVSFEDAGPVARLIDFGLAGRPFDGRPAVIKGTRDFIAPEFTAAGRVDRRADYYALGMTLLACYRPQEGSREPLDRTRVVEWDVDEPFRTLILRLTAPDAEERPASVWEIHRLLDPLGTLAIDRDGWVEAAKTALRDIRPPGMGPFLNALRERLRREDPPSTRRPSWVRPAMTAVSADEGQPAPQAVPIADADVIALSGGPGMGIAPLVESAITVAQLEGWRTIRLGSADTDSLLTTLGSASPVRHDPAQSPDTAGTPARQEPLEALVDAALRRWRTEHPEPLLIAGGPFLHVPEVVSALAAAISRTATDVSACDVALLVGLDDRVAPPPGSAVVTLRRMTHTEIAGFCQRHFSPCRDGDALVADLTIRSGGNPTVLRDLLRGYLDADIVHPGPDGWAVDLARLGQTREAESSATVHRWVWRALSGSERAIVSALTLCLNGCPAAALAGLTGLTPREFVPAIVRLQADGWVRQEDNARVAISDSWSRWSSTFGEWRADAAVRPVLDRAVASGPRGGEPWSSAWGVTLASVIRDGRVDGGMLSSLFGELWASGRHYSGRQLAALLNRMGDIADASLVLYWQARFLDLAGMHVEALRRYEQLLAEGYADTTGMVRYRTARLMEQSGRGADASELHRTVVRDPAARVTVRVEAAVALAYDALRAGDTRLAEETLAAVAPLDPPPDCAATLGNIRGLVLRAQGRLAEADAAYAAALATVPAAAQRVQLLLNRGIVARDAGRTADAEAAYLQAREVAPSTVEPAVMASVELGLANVALDREDPATATQRYHLCAIRAQSAGLVRTEGLAYLGLASAAVLQDDSATAATMLAQARERFRRCDPLLERYAATRLLMWNPAGTPAVPSRAALDVIWRREPAHTALPPLERTLVEILYAWADEDAADLADGDEREALIAAAIARGEAPLVSLASWAPPASQRRALRLAARWHTARGRAARAAAVISSMPPLRERPRAADPTAGSALG